MGAPFTTMCAAKQCNCCQNLAKSHTKAQKHRTFGSEKMRSRGRDFVVRWPLRDAQRHPPPSMIDSASGKPGLETVTSSIHDIRVVV